MSHVLTPTLPLAPVYNLALGDLKRLIKKTAEAQRMLDEPVIWSLFSQVCKNGKLCWGSRR